jgi:hypothetical protein
MKRLPSVTTPVRLAWQPPGIKAAGRMAAKRIRLLLRSCCSPTGLAFAHCSAIDGPGEGGAGGVGGSSGLRATTAKQRPPQDKKLGEGQLKKIR